MQVFLVLLPSSCFFCSAIVFSRDFVVGNFLRELLPVLEPLLLLVLRVGALSCGLLTLVSFRIPNCIACIIATIRRASQLSVCLVPFHCQKDLYKLGILN